MAPDALSPRPAPIAGTSTYQLTLRDEAIARAIASGFDRDKVCAYYELTPVGLNDVLRRIGPLVNQYRERLQLAAQMNQVFIEQLAPKGLENTESILNDPTHKEWAFTSRWVIEQARGSKLDINGGLSLEVSPQALSSIADALVALANHKATLDPVVSLDHDPHLIKGPQ
jgi:hypothetical protein